MRNQSITLRCLRIHPCTSTDSRRGCQEVSPSWKPSGTLSPTRTCSEQYRSSLSGSQHTWQDDPGARNLNKRESPPANSSHTAAVSDYSVQAARGRPAVSFGGITKRLNDEGVRTRKGCPLGTRDGAADCHSAPIVRRSKAVDEVCLPDVNTLSKIRDGWLRIPLG
jgi:hypothetical protein